MVRWQPAGWFLMVPLMTLTGCDKDKAPGSVAEPSGASVAAGLRAPSAIVGTAKMVVGAKVKLCWRNRADNPFAKNAAEFICGAELDSKESPGTKKGGVNGKQVFAALRALPKPPAFGKAWAKSPDPGKSPKEICAAIDVSDADNEWFGNYVFADAAGQAWMFLELEMTGK